MSTHLDVPRLNSERKTEARSNEISKIVKKDFYVDGHRHPALSEQVPRHKYLGAIKCDITKKVTVISRNILAWQNNIQRVGRESEEPPNK